MSRANAVALEACRILADRATEAADRRGAIQTSAQRYYDRCFGQAKTDHQRSFVEALQDNPSLTAEALADSVGRAQEAETEVVSPSSRLPTVVADEREPLSAQERMTAQTGLSRARQALQEAQEGR